MKKSARHLQKRRPHDYNKKMEPNVPKVAARKLPLPLIIVGILIILGAVFAYFLTKQKTTQTPIQKKEVSTLGKASLACPVNPSLCQDLSSYKEGSLSGRLVTGTPLLAAFAGEAEGFKLSRPSPAGKIEEFTLIIINNKEKGLIAQYYLNGTPSGKKPVQEGEQIATSSGAILSFLDGKSFVFIVQKAGEERDFEPLSPANFK